MEGALRRYALARGVLTFKFSSPGTSGVPDRIFIYNGVTVYLEVKRPGEAPRPLQLQVGRAIQNAGATWNWVDNVEDGKAFIDRLVQGDFGGGCGCVPRGLL